MDSRRRQLLIAAGTALAAPLVRAQQAQKVRRIGLLSLAPITADAQNRWQAGLRQAGYEVGKNLVVEWRSAEGDAKRLPELAAELVRLKVELVIATSQDAHGVAKQSTQTIPIVMFASNFPVERGLITSLARPGGNVTGTVFAADPAEHTLKVYQIIRDAAPKAVRIPALRYDGSPSLRYFDLQSLHRRAREMGFDVQEYPIMQASDLSSTLERIALGRPDAFFVSANLGALGVLREVGAFAVDQKLVSVSDGGPFTREGGLISYAPDIDSIRDLTVSYVDKILRGAKPADLPVQQTTKWDLVLNTKTAQAIGFKPPPALMLQVTRQIE